MKVSKLCLGCRTYGSPDWREWVLDENARRPFIKKSLDMGINFFDTANMYSHGASEEILGKTLLKFASRDDVVIATKVFNPMRDRKPPCLCSALAGRAMACKPLPLRRRMRCETPAPPLHSPPINAADRFATLTRTLKPL